VTFVVDTASPVVSLNQPATPSKNTKPSFSGKASDTTEVVVHIRNAASEEVATATATPSGGSWSTSSESELASGTYTAFATQSSSLGNEPGKSATVEFTINTAPPAVTLAQPPTPSKNQRPSFTGTASEHTQVTVHIRDSHNTEVASATASGTGGAWTSGQASQSLESGEYTAEATQESSLGNGTGHSNTVLFTVNTKPPTVSLHQPTPLSNNTTPLFTGFASDTTPVTVKIYSGATVVAEATAQGNGGEWVSEDSHPALPSGKYTAVATQPSSLGNAPGTSETVSFTVETGPPHVTLNQPKTPSNHTKPSFSGEASDHTPVIVDIYSGTSATGPIVSEATATGTGGAWTSGAASTALTTGEYTAVATQASSLLGNPPGSSSPVSFFVDTRSPTVTIEQPAALSNTANPTFKGEASDSTPVVVHIVNKANAEVAKVSTTPSGGHWSTNGEGTLSSESYSAYATQESSLGNPPGESAHVAFTVETRPPTVVLNSSSVALRSNNTSPSFNGTATDTTAVTVRVFAGSKAEGTEVASATVAGTGGAWSSPPVSPPLAGAPGPHTYTAIAEQPSSLKNPAGKSSTVTFIVDTSVPTVTIVPPPTPSNNTTPSFTGAASETTPVTLRVYEEPKENEKKEVAKLTAAVSGGTWTSAPVTLASGTHNYSAVASQESEIKNGPGESAPVKFTVDTTAPKVTLNPVAKSPSNNVLPTFSGTATDKEPVTIAVYELNKTERKLVATAEAKEPKTTWTSLAVTPALPAGNHEYAAIAEQPSSIKNPSGKSNEVKFIVDTTSPALTITGPPSPGNNLTPSFSGTSTLAATHASPEVLVKIYLDNGGVPGGEVSSAKATVANGKWAAGPASPALSKGTNTYLAVATEASLVGNPPGTAEATFIVNTEPPTVTLTGPPASSNNRTPVFEGTASDTTPVTLKVYPGKSTAGTPVASAVVVPGAGGAWKTQTTLPELKGTYTAIALEKSSIVGNHEGESKTVTFIVDPAAPTVILTPPPTWVNSATPTFSGSAGDNSLVTIVVYPGTKPEGPFVASKATATGTNGPWASGPSGPALPDGQYTAVASQANSVTHVDVGTSTSATFNVDTVPPQVTLTSSATGGSSPSTTETVSGAAGNEEDDLPHVTAQLFSGSSIGAGQVPVQSLTVNTVGQAWSGTFGGLSAGTYTVRAIQPDLAGNVGVSATSTFAVTGSSSPSSSAARPSAPPAASFTWFPSIPSVGQAVSFISSSTDSASPITAFAWDAAGTGAFAAGGPAIGTTFSSAGNHRVQLRVTDANGLSSVASEMIPVSSSLPLMQPFPVVRITSTGTRSGVKLTLLSVLASPGAQVTVQCKGRRCPLKLQTVKVQSHVAKSKKRTSGSVEFPRFERSLAAGVSLEIRVSKTGVMGKYTRFVVRRGKLPLRFDACLAGLEAKPVGCPSS
jgi:large repetitive protein